MPDQDSSGGEDDALPSDFLLGNLGADGQAEADWLDEVSTCWR